jgi:hypothetical protein
MAIPQIPPMLIDAVRRRECVLFVGAGLSQAAGLPGWKGLFSHIFKWCDRNGITIADREALEELIRQGNLLLAAGIIKDDLGEELFRRLLVDIFDDPNFSPTATHMLLPKIPFTAVLTSNYDKLLETAYARHMMAPHVITHTSTAELMAALQGRRFYILKAHGTIDQAGTIILGNKSYRELMHGNEAYTEHLKTVFRTRTVLFAGFGLSDPDLKLLLDQEHVLAKGSANVHFALINNEEFNPLVKKELEKDYNIRLLPYEPSNEYHPEVEGFFNELARLTEEGYEAASQQLSQPEAVHRATSAKAPEANLIAPESLPGREQVSEIVKALGISNGQAEAKQDGLGQAGSDDFRLLRLQLYAVARLPKYVPSSMLGTHEANRLYEHRDQLKLDGSEYFSLLRMIVEDTHGYIPGWYWFRNFKPSGIEKLILHLGFTDYHAGVRQGAFNLLASAAVPVPETVGEDYDFTAAVTADGSTEVRKAALTYLGRVAGAEYLPVIGSALVNDDAGVRRVANQSKYLVLARTNPERAIGELLEDTGGDVRDVLDELDPKGLSTTVLQKALQHAEKTIKLFAALELHRRGELSADAATPLSEEQDEELRAVGYKALMEQDVEVDIQEYNLLGLRHNYDRQFGRNSLGYKSQAVDGENLVLAAFDRYSTDELSKLVDWTEGGPGPYAYRALALKHFREVGGRIRAELSQDFEPAATELYERRLKNWTEYYGSRITSNSSLELLDTTPSTLWGLFRSERKPRSSPESMARHDAERVRSEFIAGALAGLAAHGEPADVEFGRKHLYHSEYDVRVEAVKVVSSFGDTEDFLELMKIAKSTEGLLQELAARAALKVSPDMIGVIAI